MRPLDEVEKLNSFQEICTVANEEQWCWNIACETCGHVHFVHSLFLLIDEEIPEPEYTSKKQNILSSNSKKIQEKVKDTSIDYFANNFKYPDFLGYLGIALHYSQSTENENRILTEKWIPQFITIMNRKELRGVYAKASKKRIYYLENILVDNKKILTVKDFEIIERSCSYLRHRRF